MRLLLKRDQKSGMMGGITFLLDVRADLNDREKSMISKYKLGNTTLYERDKMTNPNPGLLAAVAFKMTNLSVNVDDLSTGKRIECKDIIEMLAVEEQIKQACQTFHAVLQAASSFGGEEVFEIH